MNDFVNLYFEICNEPYFGGVTLDWQARIASVIVDTEKQLPHKHLIAQNIANEKARIDRPFPAVSIVNFHYAAPPETVAINFGLNKAIGDDETGFKGIHERTYRVEAWDFIIAGGAIFDHLDYSFTTDHEDGTATISEPTPGGGGPTIRKQFQVLKQFIDGFNFVQMAPDTKTISRVTADGVSVRTLSEPGQAYAIYAHGSNKLDLRLDLPAGTYRAQWLNPRTGTVYKSQSLDTRGGQVQLTSPDFEEDIALGIRRSRRMTEIVTAGEHSCARFERNQPGLSVGFSSSGRGVQQLPELQ